MEVGGHGRGWGLSLIEVIFSLALLAGVALLVLNLFPTSMVTVKKAEQRMQANLLAETLLAEQAAAPFETLLVGGPPLTRTERVGNVEYNTRVVILEIPDRNTDYLKNVRVSIDWKVQNLQHSLVRELWVANIKK